MDRRLDLGGLLGEPGAERPWEGLPAGTSIGLRDGRGAWIQVVSGEVELNGTRLSAGDGAVVEHVGLLELRALAASDILLFDLA